MSQRIKLPFSNRYDYAYSNKYYHRHKKGFFKRFSNGLEQRMLAKALKMAGVVKVVLDLPCGAGRFFETILKAGCEKLIGGDLSVGMLQVIKEQFPAVLLQKIELLELDAAHIALPDKSVDTMVCMRLMHHIHDPAHRQVMYQEMRRVARHSVCVSNWIEGNYKSYRENLRAQKNGEKSRCFDPALLEKELEAAGFKVTAKVDMLPGISYWRTYVLQV